ESCVLDEIAEGKPACHRGTKAADRHDVISPDSWVSGGRIGGINIEQQGGKITYVRSKRADVKAGAIATHAELKSIGEGCRVEDGPSPETELGAVLQVDGWS